MFPANSNRTRMRKMETEAVSVFRGFCVSLGLFGQIFAPDSRAVAPLDGDKMLLTGS